MYRLLIVDDEPTIRRGMLSCIDWEKYGIGTIKEAKNGAEALREALSFHPHILLTDIRMPVMDGIELVSQVREHLPDCKIVIMSGYDDFDYAKSLMRLKVTEYLLKPVDEDELVQVFTRLIRDIKDEEARELNLKTASLLLQENLPQLKLNFILKVLEGGFPDLKEMARYATVLHIHIPANICEFRAIIIAPNDLSGLDRADLTESSVYEIIHTVEEFLVDSGFLCPHTNHIIGLIYGNSLGTDLLALHIRYLIKERTGITVSVSIGPAAQSISEINHSYKQAISMRDNKMYKGKRTVVQIALRYVDEHWNQDISLADIAKIAFVTPNYLSKIFKEEMNVSFIDYLNRLRVENAKQLLLYTNLKTYEIAEKVGYKDYKYFSAMLKKLTGFSPREFRRN